MPQYHSKFGGLWIDRSDWREELVQRNLSTSQAALISQFAESGYVILPQACTHRAVDAFRRLIETSFKTGNDALLYQDHRSHDTLRLIGPVDKLQTRVVDAYVASREALNLFTNRPLMNFLKLIFESQPLLFQSLSFSQGSQQGLHQDTAYVVVNNPLEMAACWIALEDVREGSGELMYDPGSHRYPDWTFGPGRKHWDSSVDGDRPHLDWSIFLANTAKSKAGGVKTFLAKKGDVLVWHADLSHGGLPVRCPELSRQSLVGHFCPVAAKPKYFLTAPSRTAIHNYRGLAYSSMHYDLNQVAPQRSRCFSGLFG